MPNVPNVPNVPNALLLWAAALARRLVETGEIELRSKRLPVAEIAHALHFSGDEDEDDNDNGDE